MPRQTQPPAIVLEQEIAKLRHDLDFARNAVLQLMPDELFRLLTGYYDCKTREDVWQRWFNKTVEQIIERAEPNPAREMQEFSSSSDRAFCPLCGGSADNIYDVKGFAYPEGLSWHLHGSHKATQCIVTKVAIDLALDHVSRQGRN